MVGLDVLKQSTISIKITDNELASTCVDIIMFTMDYSHAVVDGVCVSGDNLYFLKAWGSALMIEITRGGVRKTVQKPVRQAGGTTYVASNKPE